MWRRGIIINVSCCCRELRGFNTKQPKYKLQIADILTKDLGSKAHRRHRDVIFGKKAIEIIASKLPDSRRLYLTRHNDELKKNAQAIRLAQARAK